MAGSTWERCKKRTPKGRDNFYQCTRKSGHDGQHADNKGYPHRYWDQEPDE